MPSTNATLLPGDHVEHVLTGDTFSHIVEQLIDEGTDDAGLRTICYQEWMLGHATTASPNTTLCPFCASATIDVQQLSRAHVLEAGFAQRHPTLIDDYLAMAIP